MSAGFLLPVFLELSHYLWPRFLTDPISCTPSPLHQSLLFSENFVPGMSVNEGCTWSCRLRHHMWRHIYVRPTAGAFAGCGERCVLSKEGETPHTKYWGNTFILSPQHGGWFIWLHTNPVCSADGLMVAKEDKAAELGSLIRANRRHGSSCVEVTVQYPHKCAWSGVDGFNGVKNAWVADVARR